MQPSRNSSRHISLQSLSESLDYSTNESVSARSPVGRVVKLLETMDATLQQEQEEDDLLYKKLSCWCTKNKDAKEKSLSEAESKVGQLEPTVQELESKGSLLQSQLEEATTSVSANKRSLDLATAQRKKEAQTSHDNDLQSTQAIESLKAAIVVLQKHHDLAFPQIPSVFLAARGLDMPWEGHESESERSLDAFMERNAFKADSTDGTAFKLDMVGAVTTEPRNLRAQSVSTPSVFSRVQDETTTSAPAESSAWSITDVQTVHRALEAAASFADTQHKHRYVPSYNARSGEVLGVLKQLRDNMEDALEEAQKAEMATAAGFVELRDAKLSEIQAGEAMAEEKEAALADAHNRLAETRDDLKQTRVVFAEDQKFLGNLGRTCTEASTNYDRRKRSRVQEGSAISQALQFLKEEMARDQKAGSAEFIQLTNRVHRIDAKERSAAAAVIHHVTQKVSLHASELSYLAARVKLDPFSKVRAAIDHMIIKLKQQEKDEAKKHDWCTSEIQANKMSLTKTVDQKENLEGFMEALHSDAGRFSREISDATEEIKQLQLSLQRAAEERQSESVEFQATYMDQRLTLAALKKALQRLSQYYKSAHLIQTGFSHHVGGAQAALPSAQATYKPNSGAAAVMAMLEDLIQSTKRMMTGAEAAETEAQQMYAQNVADTFTSIDALQKVVVSKTRAKARVDKEAQLTTEDHASFVAELASLAKYDEDMHGECDTLMESFQSYQAARDQEIEALQDAKQILSGAQLT